MSNSEEANKTEDDHLDCIKSNESESTTVSNNRFLTAPVNQPTNHLYSRENSRSSLVVNRCRDNEIPFNVLSQQANAASSPPTPPQTSNSTTIATTLTSSLSNNSFSLPSINFSPNYSQALFNWQASKNTVKERLATVFNRETLADIHFLVGKESKVKLPAHKFILSIGSAVFDAMFNGKMATTDDIIELPDVEPPAFLNLLRFLYTDEVQICPETVMMTLYVAKKYAVAALEKACVEYLKQNLSSDNAFLLLTQARLFDEPGLAKTCLDTIDKNTSESLTADGFLDIDHQTLMLILERDTLRIREVVLFNAVVRWAEAECIRQSLTLTSENKRRVLGRALYLIRIPLMTVEEFAVEVAQSGILTDREVVNLFLYFIVNPKPTVQFPDSPRSCITEKEQVVCRFGRIESRWGYSGTSDRIRFTVDRRIFVIGFALYGSIHGPSDYECNLQIIHTGTGKVLASNDTTFSCDGSPNTFKVLFKMPVEILPNTNYTACATLKGSDSHYGTSGSRKVVVDLHGGGKVTFQFSYAAGCNNGTSVEDGQIPEILFFT